MLFQTRSHEQVSLDPPDLAQSSEQDHSHYSRALALLGRRSRQWLQDQDGVHGLPTRLCIAVLLYAVAVMGRDGLHEVLPGSVRYLTFFPALLIAGFVCGPLPSFGLLLLLASAFVFAGAAVLIPALSAVRVQQRLKEHDEQQQWINEELRHRLKNLLALASSICTQTMKADAPQEELKRDIMGRIQALAAAQEFLSISFEGTDVGVLIRTVIDPLRPDPTRLLLTGSSVALPLPQPTPS